MYTMLVGFTAEERDELCKVIGHFPQFSLVFLCSTYADAAEAIKLGAVQFVFLSTKLRDMPFSRFAEMMGDTCLGAFAISEDDNPEDLYRFIQDAVYTGKILGCMSKPYSVRGITSLCDAEIRRGRERTSAWAGVGSPAL